MPYAYIEYKGVCAVAVAVEVNCEASLKQMMVRWSTTSQDRCGYCRSRKRSGGASQTRTDVVIIEAESGQMGHHKPGNMWLL